MIRSACREDFPQDCDDIWENEKNEFRFHIVCGKRNYDEFHSFYNTIHFLELKHTGI